MFKVLIMSKLISGNLHQIQQPIICKRFLQHLSEKSMKSFKFDFKEYVKIYHKQQKDYIENSMIIYQR